MILFDQSNLPDDPRDNGFVDAHGPDGRIARVREVNEPFLLVDPETGDRLDMPAGGFLVWEDGAWRAVQREEFLDGAWDVARGPGGASAIDWAE